MTEPIPTEGASHSTEETLGNREVTDLPFLTFRSSMEDSPHFIRNHFKPVVDLLVELKEAGVDRTQHPVIAKFASEKPGGKILDLMEANSFLFQHALIRETILAAKEAGVHVEIEDTRGSTYNEAMYERRSSAPVVEEPESKKHFLSTLRNWRKRQSPEPPSSPPPPPPDFRLKYTTENDMKGYEMYQGVGRYTRQKHTISLKPPVSSVE